MKKFFAVSGVSTTGGSGWLKATLYSSVLRNVPEGIFNLRNIAIAKAVMWILLASPKEAIYQKRVYC